MQSPSRIEEFYAVQLYLIFQLQMIFAIPMSLPSSGSLFLEGQLPTELVLSSLRYGSPYPSPLTSSLGLEPGWL